MTSQGKKIGVIIPAAGKGTRMGGSRGKQFLELGQKPIIVHTLERFQSIPLVDTIVPVAGDAAAGELRGLVAFHKLSKVADVVAGGKERQDSVWNGLQALASRSIAFVIVHDAVRPFIDRSTIEQVLNAAMEDYAAVTAVRSKDTVKISADGRYASGTVQRETVWIAQTPQAFEFSLLYRAYEKAFLEGFYGTDDACLVERLGARVRIVAGSYDNIKITTPEDLELAQLIAKRLKIK